MQQDMLSRHMETELRKMRDSHVQLPAQRCQLHIPTLFKLFRSEWDQGRDSTEHDARLQRWDYSDEIVVRNGCHGSHESCDPHRWDACLKRLHAFFFQKSLVLSWWLSKGEGLVQIPAESEHTASD